MKNVKLLIVGAALVALSGCSSHVSKGIPNDGVMTQDEVTFPNPDSTWIDAPTYPNLENLGKISKGMSKDQVRDLIGHPHYSEGIYGVREWDYLFNIKAKSSDLDKICQFKLVFDKDMRVGSTFFNPEGCQSPKEDKKIELQSDFLFDFDKSILKSESVVAVANIADKIKAENASRVSVTGYTDRLGSDAYNVKLSKNRANSVKQELVNNGIDEDIIETSGLGKKDQVVDCYGEKGAKLKECLAPNRRVVIKFY